MYGAIAGGGAAIGLVLGGLLTEYASWRWTLLINVPIAILAAMAATRLVHESRAEGESRYDIPGALNVYRRACCPSSTGSPGPKPTAGRRRSPSRCWSSVWRCSWLSSSSSGVRTIPLLPLRVVLDRNRGGSFLASLLVGIALFGTFLFLTYYMQADLGYSALKTGFAFLPFSAGIIFSATLASSSAPELGPRTLMCIGLLLGAVGLAWFTQIGVHTSYVTHVLPAELMVSIGLGFAFVPFSSTALIGVAPHDAGVASALVNATQQVGGSLGTALLNTVAASATASYLLAHHGNPAFTTRPWCTAIRSVSPSAPPSCWWRPSSPAAWSGAHVVRCRPRSPYWRCPGRRSGPPGPEHPGLAALIELSLSPTVRRLRPARRL